jgi:hypothetical protein
LQYSTNYASLEKLVEIFVKKIPLQLTHAHEQSSGQYSDYSLSKGKGKSIPLQAWTGPEGSRSLRFPDFMTIGT